MYSHYLERAIVYMTSIVILEVKVQEIDLVDMERQSNICSDNGLRKTPPGI